MKFIWRFFEFVLSSFTFWWLAGSKWKLTKFCDICETRFEFASFNCVCDSQHELLTINLCTKHHFTLQQHKQMSHMRSLTLNAVAVCQAEFHSPFVHERLACMRHIRDEKRSLSSISMAHKSSLPVESADVWNSILRRLDRFRVNNSAILLPRWCQNLTCYRPAHFAICKTHKPLCDIIDLFCEIIQITFCGPLSKLLENILSRSIIPRHFVFSRFHPLWSFTENVSTRACIEPLNWAQVCSIIRRVGFTAELPRR